MNKWHIEFDPKAEKELAKLGRSEAKIILNYLRNKVLVSPDPRVFGKALIGNKAGLWRYRVGKYRIISKIEDGKFIIFIVRVAKRDKVYD